MANRATVVGRGWIGSWLSSRLQLPLVSHHEQVNTPIAIICAGPVGRPTVDQFTLLQGIELVRWHLQLRQRPQTHIVVGSGCIWTGHPPQGWREDDPPVARHLYARFKALEEQLLRPQDSLIRIRMPHLGDGSERCLLSKVAQYPKLVNYLNSITALEDLAPVVEGIVSGHIPSGRYNLASPQPIWTKDIAQLLGRQASWWDIDEFERLHPRSHATLNVDRIQRYVTLAPTLEMLEKSIRRMKKSML